MQQMHRASMQLVNSLVNSKFRVLHYLPRGVFASHVQISTPHTHLGALGLWESQISENSLGTRPCRHCHNTCENYGQHMSSQSSWKCRTNPVCESEKEQLPRGREVPTATQVSKPDSGPLCGNIAMTSTN